MTAIVITVLSRHSIVDQHPLGCFFTLPVILLDTDRGSEAAEDVGSADSNCPTSLYLSWLYAPTATRVVAYPPVLKRLPLKLGNLV